MSEPRWSWTQPICPWCYAARYPGREPTTLVDEFRELEVCVDCGNQTGEGIYVRTDPKIARYPTRRK